MRILHLDYGPDMRGGQWQCLATRRSAGNGCEPARSAPDAAGPPGLPSAASRRSSLQPVPAGADGARVRPGARARCTVAQLGRLARRRAAGRLEAGGLPDQTGALSRWKYCAAGPLHRRVASSSSSVLVERRPGGEDRRGLRRGSCARRSGGAGAHRRARRAMTR